MKKTFIIISAIISLVSCSKEKEIISKSEEYLKKDLLDSKTYQRISVEIDTIKQHQRIEIYAYSDSLTADMYLKLAQDNVEYMKIWCGSTSYFGQSQFQDYSKKVNEYLDSTKKYQSISQKKFKQSKDLIGTPSDSIIRYNVNLKYYAVNKMGNKAIGETTVYVNKEGEPYKKSGE